MRMTLPPQATLAWRIAERVNIGTQPTTQRRIMPSQVAMGHEAILFTNLHIFYRENH
jgi:hypothetical protein